MSDNQFMLLFWLLLFSVGELFIIGVLIYGIIKGLSVWQVSWNEWRDNDQARKEQTEAIKSKLNEHPKQVAIAGQTAAGA